jgi:hypothetical protein
LLLEAKMVVTVDGEPRLVDLTKAFIAFILQIDTDTLESVVKSSTSSMISVATSQPPASRLVRAGTSPKAIQGWINEKAAPSQSETSRFEMMQIQELVEPIIQCVGAVRSLQALNSADLDIEDLTRILDELKERSTVKVSFFGGRSVGKSTLLNALLGRDLAYLSANESTGCVTEMWYCPPEKQESMEVVFISLDEFASMRAEMREKMHWIEDQLSQMREQQQQQLMSAVAGAVDAQGSVKISSALSTLLCAFGLL